MRRALALVLALSLAVGLFGACGDSSVPSPFTDPDASADSAGSDGGDGASDSTADVPGDADPTLGGPCLDDAQCNDGIECTSDRCDQTLQRCRFTPDHALCADSVYCDGTEVCDFKLGCREGDPVACSDDSTCTIDACVEATQSCSHTPRDIDQDGDPDKNCGGGDCNDTNPLVSSQQKEVCANGLDDDCDGTSDESDCATPKHDTCVEPLEITSSGSYSLSLVAAKNDYAASCAAAGALRDVVAAIVVPQGAPLDVDVIAEVPYGSLAIAAAEQCGDASTELGCHNAVESLKSSMMARLRLRALPPGAYPIYVFATGATPVTLHVKLLPAEPAPSYETCGTAAPLAAAAHQKAVVIGVADDVITGCSTTTGELVYELTLSEPKDLDVYAASLDGWGAPSLSLLGNSCGLPSDELYCATSQPAHLYARALPAGAYKIAVSASAPSEIDVVAELSAPTIAPADELCAGAPSLAAGETIPVVLSDHTDDVKLGCVVGAPDAAYALELPGKSDVLLVGRFSQSDTAGVLLAKPGCQTASDLIACGTAYSTPVRAAAYGVPAGSYRAVIETLKSNPTELTAFVRPASSPILVAFADSCAQAVTIPASGGRFIGNTANASADYDAGCDLGGQAPGGAPDQMLKLSLSEKKRVVLDMKGSGYSTLLDVRKGPACPGSEIVAACAAGYVADRSYLDLDLDPGQYFVQVDGYGGASGPWVLDVHVADP